MYTLFIIKLFYYFVNSAPFKTGSELNVGPRCFTLQDHKKIIKKEVGKKAGLRFMS